MIQDFGQRGFLTQSTLPTPMTVTQGMEPKDLLVSTNGTLVECQKVPTLKDFLAATGNFHA